MQFLWKLLAELELICEKLFEVGKKFVCHFVFYLNFENPLELFLKLCIEFKCYWTHVRWSATDIKIEIVSLAFLLVSYDDDNDPLFT